MLQMFFKLGHFFTKIKLKFVANIIEFVKNSIYSHQIPITLDYKRFHLIHGGLGCVIHRNAKIGENTKIYQNVTIGGNGKIINGIPKIGNNCIIYTGAVIIGEVEIGNNCIIGANTVVTKNIPDNTVVYGNPNILRKLTDEYIH